jgi:putative ubiquitin-RnfH superfamily antitoxin RatB of RatAB toxin-antitoxin module
MTKVIDIEVAYATPSRQEIVVVGVPEGTNLREAAKLSGINKWFPEIDYDVIPMGIFGKKVAKPETELVSPGIRIELYRPLLIDPKQARLNRAAKKAAQETKA